MQSEARYIVVKLLKTDTYKPCFNMYLGLQTHVLCLFIIWRRVWEWNNAIK